MATICVVACGACRGWAMLAPTTVARSRIAALLFSVIARMELLSRVRLKGSGRLVDEAASFVCPNEAGSFVYGSSLSRGPNDNRQRAGRQRDKRVRLRCFCIFSEWHLALAADDERIFAGRCPGLDLDGNCHFALSG